MNRFFLCSALFAASASASRWLGPPDYTSSGQAHSGAELANQDRLDVQFTSTSDYYFGAGNGQHVDSSTFACPKCHMNGVFKVIYYDSENPHHDQFQCTTTQCETDSACTCSGYTPGEGVAARSIENRGEVFGLGGPVTGGSAPAPQCCPDGFSEVSGRCELSGGKCRNSNGQLRVFTYSCVTSDWDGMVGRSNCLYKDGCWSVCNAVTGCIGTNFMKRFNADMGGCQFYAHEGVDEDQFNTQVQSEYSVLWQGADYAERQALGLTFGAQATGTHWTMSTSGQAGHLIGDAAGPNDIIDSVAAVNSNFVCMVAQDCR